MTGRERRLGKYLAYVLRHHPEAADVTLDAAGWVDLAELVAGMQRSGEVATVDDVRHAVRVDEKGRFEVVNDRIRAAQGHSLEVDLGLPVVVPPDVLFHGTVARFVEPIRREGLRAGDRQFVHLSSDEATARRVGSRHGQPVILTIDSGRMVAHGVEFRRSSNGVWLVDSVAPEWIRFPD